MKQQKGFVQIPILIAIIVGILVIVGGGYFGYIKFKDYQKQKIEKEKQTQDLILEQQKALEELQKSLEESKTESQGKDEEITGLQEELGGEKNKSKDLTIQASELESYLDGVIQLFCGQTEGSGTLWNFSGNLQYSVLTNKHVIEEGNCIVGKTGKGVYRLDSSQYNFNSYTDIAILKINSTPVSGGSSPISSLNYKISTLQKCPTKMPLGSAIVIIGFPVYAEQVIIIPGEEKTATESYRTVANGIISAHDTSVIDNFNLPYPNYFVSAKIDSGNSGGIALSKTESGLCILGVPTWLTIGQYETQGIVQNIHNIFYAP